MGWPTREPILDSDSYIPPPERASVTDERNPAAAIEFIASTGPALAGLCQSCMQGGYGANPRPRVRVVDIAQVKADWIARGEVRTDYCDMCGAVYEELVRYVPIECATFPCPHCGPASQLITEILSITESDTGYNFVASLKCDSCSRQRRLSKVLGGLSKVSRVKVGPSGVEVEIKP